MKTWHKIVLAIAAISILAIFAAYYTYITRDSREPSFVAWKDHCSECHGPGLEGSQTARGLTGRELDHGESVDELMEVITNGIAKTTMPGYGDKLEATLIKGLAIYISERRQKFPKTADSYTKVELNNRIIKSRHHDFRLERIANLQSRPYSVAYLPDGSLLVAEKIRGLSLIRADHTQGPVITGTPQVWGTAFKVAGTWVNWGSVLDIALHPDYDQNGWVYLSHTDRCQLSCGWPLPATMVRVVRGRIKQGKWIDQETIWSVDKDHYTPVPDGVAGGRLAFDGKGFLYITIGGKNTYSKLHDLNTPFGKIHRVRSDGSIPNDNPFWMDEAERSASSTIHTVWSYGHRTTQGLDGHPKNGEIWSTEMGPRGGDEINKIAAGGNYGWPLFTNGLDYDGDEISIGQDLGLDYKLEDTVLPVVDFTPAPAISNFTFHNGGAFSKWEEDLLVGSLKAKTLYRLRLKDDRMVESEKIITDFGRIRDVEMGGDGYVYLAIEHGDDGSIWRLRPL